MQSITEKDQETLKKLEIINNELYKKHEELNRIEIYLPQDKNRYIKVFANLLSIKEEYESLLGQLDFDKDNIVNYIFYILGSERKYYKGELFEGLLLNTKPSIKKIKICNDIDKTNISKRFNSYSSATDFFSDTINLLLYYIEQEILDKENQDIKEYLNLIKYKIDYLNLRVKEEYEPFKPSKGLVIYRKSLARKINLTEQQLAIIGSDVYTESIILQESYIPIMLKQPFELPISKVNLILRICYLKAMLQMVDDFSLNLFLTDLKENTKKHYYKDNDKIVKTLNRLVEEVNEDRKKLIIK